MTDFDAVGKDHDILDISAINASRGFYDLIANHMRQHDGKITVAGIALTKVVTKTDMEALYKGFDKGFAAGWPSSRAAGTRRHAKRQDASARTITR